MIFKPTTKERRRDHRFQVNRPVKLRDAQTGKYFTGTTHDVSASGAMIMIDGRKPLRPGQKLDVGIAWTKQQVLLRQEDMIPSDVTRSLGLDGKLTIAVRFEQPQDLAMSA